MQEISLRVILQAVFGLNEGERYNEIIRKEQYQFNTRFFLESPQVLIPKRNS